MARLSDVPVVLRRVGAVTFAKRVWQEVEDDQLFTWGAALAYSWLFAVFPFLIFLLTLVPLLPQNVINEAYARIQISLYEWLPANSAWTLWENIRRVLDGPPPGLLSLGLLVTIFAASGGVLLTVKLLGVGRARRFTPL